jgi:heme oxygenase
LNVATATAEPSQDWIWKQIRKTDFPYCVRAIKHISDICRLVVRQVSRELELQFDQFSFFRFDNWHDQVQNSIGAVFYIKRNLLNIFVARQRGREKLQVIAVEN